MLDAVRGYLQLASGLTEVTVNKAREVAQSLLSGDIESVIPDSDTGARAAEAARGVGAQVQDLADDIVHQASANRELLVGLIRTEIDRAAGRLGFVREEELAALRRQVQRLEQQLEALAPAAPSVPAMAAPGGSAVAAGGPGKKAPATKAAAKKAPATKAAKKTAAKRTAAKKAPATTTSAPRAHRPTVHTEPRPGEPQP